MNDTKANPSDASLSPGLGVGLLASTSVFSTISGIYSSIASARENQRNLRFNQDLMKIRAKDSLFRGKLAEQEYRKQGKKLIGSQRAALAAQGLALDDGTALVLQEQAAASIEEGALTIRTNAMREAWGFESEASTMKMEEGMARFRGRMGVAETIVGGSSQLAQIAYQENKLRR